MNHRRRGKLLVLATEATRLQEKYEDLKLLAIDLQDKIRELLDEEQEYFDAMPESLASGTNGDAAQAAIDALQEAVDGLDEIMNVTDHESVEEKLLEAAQ